jgi:DNA repair exonuclease SbcCD ATPase subunit
MDIKLNWLKLKNFKGIKDFTLKIDGKNASVYGENGVGKTTLADSFLWLLFGKDSTDRSAFKVKPQDEYGNDIHHLQTEVEAELAVDGKPLKLRKILEEKWTKKRGSAEAELTGNTISYWWDDVPVKESEFKLRISELINEGIFRMITNPMYFNTRLSWQDRRKILLEMCGDLSDEQVIASDEKLSRLTEILQGKSIEEYKKILAERIKRLEKERADIPPRIDELTLSLPQENTDYSAVEAELRQYKDELEGIELGLTDASKAATEYRRKQQELYGLKCKLEAVKARIDKEANAERDKLVNELNSLTHEKYELESKKAVNNNIIEQNKNLSVILLSELNQLREEWKNINSQQFIEPEEGSFICPTCGQQLPQEEKEARLAEMKARFEADKKADLERNVIKGKSKKADFDRIQTESERIAQKNGEFEIRLMEIDKRIAEIDQELANQKETEPDYSANAEYASLHKQIKALEAELSQPVEDKTSALLQKKREVQEKIDECNRILNNRTVAENTKKRIEELKAEERRLAQQITELEGHKYLCEQFTVAKVNLLEDKINSRFKYVKFKLFEIQINGGIAETCQALVNTNGVYVPFDDANHAGKVNAGLDIINSLCSYYNVTAPIFIDFRESVSRIIETNSQVINLVKSEPDKTLRVVLEE